MDFGRTALLFGWVLKWIDYGMLVKEGEIWKVRDVKRQEEKDEKVDRAAVMRDSEKGIWQRFKDTIELWIFNMRGIGWNWEVGGIPERAPQSNS